MMRAHIQYFILALAILLSAQAFAGAGLTYHGRLLDPNGDPVIGSSVQFKVQLRTPGAENCLLYEEVQVKDLSQSSGVFSVTINDGTGTRLDSSGYGIDQIFANRNAYTFAAATCASGTTYIPNATDGRKIQVLFNDGRYPAGQWEPAPPMAVNFVPIAIESMQVGGYKKESLIKIADGVPQAGTELNAASWTELLALIAGTTTQYVKPGSASFTAAPQWSGTPSTGNDLANKTYVDAQIAAGLPNVGTAGINCTIPVSISGPGSPQIQICADSGCSTVVQGWTSSASSIVNNQYLQIRQTSDAAGGASVQATVIAGGTASIWSVANAGGDCVSGTPPVGTVCTDGSIYAGLSPDGSVKMFTTRCDYGMTWNGSACTGTRSPQNWNNGTSNWTTTNYTNGNTGKANTAGLVALVDAGSPYQASNACKNLNDSGHTDWYVPALNELNVLYVGKNTIRNFDTSGTWYWSATETNNSYNGWAERFSDGAQNGSFKNYTYYVRCVRR